jgi:hypothetical protein
MTRRLSSGELLRVMELYRHGLSTYQLARQFGTDRHAITRHLRLGGVELRPRHRFTPELVEQATRLYLEGSSLAAISKQVGLTPAAVSTALKRAGVELRDRPGRPA